MLRFDRKCKSWFPDGRMSNRIVLLAFVQSRADIEVYRTTTRSPGFELSRTWTKYATGASLVLLMRNVARDPVNHTNATIPGGPNAAEQRLR